MRAFLWVVVSFFVAVSFAGEAPVGTYHLYLYFGDETPFLDELILGQDASGAITGSLHVPKDFDASLESVQLAGERLTFHVSLPEKYHEAYPQGLDYELQFRPAASTDYERFVGFVTAAPASKYVGSVVGFRKAR